MYLKIIHLNKIYKFFQEFVFKVSCFNCIVEKSCFKYVECKQELVHTQQFQIRPACKASCVQQLGTSGFSHWGSEFCSQLAQQANEFFWGNSHYGKTVINPAHQIFFFFGGGGGLVIKITLGLVHASCSLPEWQAV